MKLFLVLGFLSLGACGQNSSTNSVQTANISSACVASNATSNFIGATQVDSNGTCNVVLNNPSMTCSCIATHLTNVCLTTGSHGVVTVQPFNNGTGQVSDSSVIICK